MRHGAATGGDLGVRLDTGNPPPVVPVNVIVPQTFRRENLADVVAMQRNNTF